ncbi:MAG: polysaccharide deacetylase family protein [Rhodospirillaceae bacterium]|jgi:allantoinase|nr:polysaccharide deacetylase family protein [Rhodospirillaceae bacterium]MBT3495014.1 polysaccharide deacetylase family protein [Rhodospirillaceae bacterium]MBT3780588.1 polysaccharide deacetylase family protein [Rhodospirillaceae bacterium]MBT3975800.1 polysaccharide deacetylase family protein [Rhodospirillaceae bacterium]MBT4168504.1 polysaccharide deacetylase family protein [Rhodospirillaceae bacterium]
MPKWNLPGDARLALSIVVNVEEGAEMNITEGDRGPEIVDELGVALHKPVRNYSNESNYLYGLKAGAPRVMKLLDDFGFQATFTAAAQALEKAPDLTRAIVDGGHEVCSHGWRWVHQYYMDEEAERAFIRKAISSIEATTGKRPTGWLSRYLLTDNTRRLLMEEGFTYHMDDFSGDKPFWDNSHERPIMILPYAVDSNDMKMWTAPSLTPADWLQYAVDSFDWLYREGADDPQMMSFGLHLRIIGRPGRIGYLEKFFQHVAAKPDVWITTRQQIAENWAAQNPAPR